MFRSQQTEMFPRIAPHQAATYPYQVTSMPAVTAASDIGGINISEIMNMMIMLIVVVMMMKMMTNVTGEMG